MVLVAVNAKYCHTSLSVRSISGYLKTKGYDTDVAEFTVNDRISRVVRRLAELDEDIYAFSCYIWNIGFVTSVIKQLRLVCPTAQMWIGGPEVSFDPQSYDFADKVICGEGEQALLSILSGECSDRIVYGSPLDNLDELPFLYENYSGDKLVYYESSRGCPFNCAYCLSSVVKGVRYRSIDKVFEDIKRFETMGIQLVKFVDRTFNADKSRSLEIWNFILQNCKKTAFHFEIEGELLDDEQIELLGKFPKGAVQLEIGVQSTNPNTLDAVNRKSNTDKLIGIIKRLSENGNVHIHADLIAGMPYEDYRSFARSFNDLFMCRPHCIQLGFLKLLKGSGLRNECNRWNYRYMPDAPYTVLSNDFVSYNELKRLEDIEYVVDKFYNSGCFEASLEYLFLRYSTPFDFFEKLAMYMEQNGLFDRPLSRKYLYEVLYCFSGDDEEFINRLKLDYLCANGRPVPKILGGDRLFEIEGFEEKYNKVKLMFNKNKR